MLYWVIDFIDKGKIIDSIDFLDDQVIVYAGLYGVPSYCMWHLAKDKTKDLYVGLHFRLSLIKYKSIIFYDEFIVKDAIFDVHSEMYKVYAEGAAFSFLDSDKSKGLIATTFTNNKSQPISGKRVLEDVITSFSEGNIVVEAQDPLVDLVKYTSISFDHEFTILDLITKICKDNRWEWYLRSDKLFISNAFVLQEAHVSLTQADSDKRNFINYINFTNITLPSDTCEPGASFEDQGRVVWVKFYVGGKIGDQMSFMVYNHKYKFLKEESFVESLDGHAREVGDRRLMKSYKQFPVIIGKIFNTPSNDNINKYEAATFGGDVRNRTNDLNTNEIKTKYVGTEKKVIGGDNLKLTTPYAGDGVGVQYPQQDSNAILFSPDGDREFGLVGPRFFGHAETVPKRDNAQDYRLQVPGGTIIINKDGEMFLSPSSEISMTVGGIDATNTTEPVSGKIVVGSSSIEIQDSGGTNIITVSGGEVSINGASVKIDGGIVEINGVKIIKGGIIDCQMVKTSGGVVPPNIM